MGIRKKSHDSSQDSVDQPRHKKAKIGQPIVQATEDSTFQSSNSDLSSNIFTLIQSQKSTKDSNVQELIVKKGDSIKKRINLIERKLFPKEDGEIPNQNQIILMSSGEGIQKLLTIIEIFKKKAKEFEGFSLEQFNKLDKYETVISDNEILSRKLNVPVFYCLLRVYKTDKEGGFTESDDSISDLQSWTKND